MHDRNPQTREADRLESLRSYGVLDTPPEADYDGLTALLALACAVPMALVCLVEHERQWFKSHHGLELTQTPIEDSFCRHCVTAGSDLVIPDTLADSRFADTLLVRGEPQVRAYAGVPLVGRDGLPLGAVCIMDTVPRGFGEAELTALRTVARQVVALLELRRADLTSGRCQRQAATLAVPELHDLTDPLRLRQALDDGELVPYFQPIVNLETGRRAGFEALLRWQHPHLGVVEPSRFLPVVESSGLIMPVGRSVLHDAVEVLSALQATRPGFGLTLSVNLSPAQLAEPGFAHAVVALLHQADLDPRLLSLELTETARIGSDRGALRELRLLGTRPSCACSTCRSRRSSSTTASCTGCPGTGERSPPSTRRSSWPATWGCLWWPRASNAPTSSSASRTWAAPSDRVPVRVGSARRRPAVGAPLTRARLRLPGRADRVTAARKLVSDHRRPHPPGPPHRSL